MELFAQQVMAGLASGAIYACIALALVMIYQAIGHVNFAQGEMATFSTFLSWQMMQWGSPYWAAFVAAVVLSFAGGMLIDTVVFRPIRKASVLSQIVMFVGLLAILNSLSGFIWDFTSKPFPTPLGSGPLSGFRFMGMHQAAMMAITALMLVLLYCFFRFTSVGLAMQAAAENPDSARLVGVRVELMIALGWGMAAGIGAVAGIMIAPIVFLEPNMMLGIMLYGFAGAVLGGLASPLGAVIGGFLVGLIENLAGTYIPAVGAELKLTIALAIIIVVLVVKPSGLLGPRHAQRV